MTEIYFSYSERETEQLYRELLIVNRFATEIQHAGMCKHPPLPTLKQALGQVKERRGQAFDAVGRRCTIDVRRVDMPELHDDIRCALALAACLPLRRAEQMAPLFPLLMQMEQELAQARLWNDQGESPFSLQVPGAIGTYGCPQEGVR